MVAVIPLTRSHLINASQGVGALAPTLKTRKIGLQPLGKFFSSVSAIYETLLVQRFTLVRPDCHARGASFSVGGRRWGFPLPSYLQTPRSTPGEQLFQDTQGKEAKPKVSCARHSRQSPDRGTLWAA